MFQKKALLAKEEIFNGFGVNNNTFLVSLINSLITPIINIIINTLMNNFIK